MVVSCIVSTLNSIEDYMIFTNLLIPSFVYLPWNQCLNFVLHDNIQDFLYFNGI